MKIIISQTTNLQRLRDIDYSKTPSSLAEE